MAAKVSHLFSYLLFLLLPLILSHATLEAATDDKKPSPFDFLKHLQGCHKGEKLEGLHELKQYLSNFGYLNYNHLKNQSLSNDDDFDDFLEEAIKTYQLNYHLKPTGTLDPQTASKMMRPRCGVPDIVNGTSSMRSGKKRHHRGTNSFRTVSHYSFFQGNPKWPADKAHLTYEFSANTNPDIFGPVARAFDKWASVSHFTFARVENNNNGDIKISFDRGDHGDGNAFDGRGGTLAHAYSPTDGRFHFDADESWSIGPVPNAYDVETVALHEIGHLLGLGHSSVEDAIMYPSVASGTTKGLHGDDIQGIKALYNV